MKYFKKKDKNALVSNILPAAVNQPASRWGGWKTWLNIVFLCLALGVAVFSIEQAHWIEPQPSLTLVLFLSILYVRLLTAARLPGWAVHIAAITGGAVVMIWQGAAILPGTGIGGLFNLLGSWLQGGSGLQEAELKAVFGVFLVIITWLAGYLSTWFVLRWRNPWVAVGLGIIIVMVNLSNLPGKNFLLFTFFLLAAVLLIIQTNIVRQQVLSGRIAGYSGKSILYLVVSLFCITILAVSMSWFTPQIRLPSLQNAIAAAMPWKDNITGSGLNVLNAVPSKKAYNTASRLQDLNFGKTWHSSDEVIYTVMSPQPAYWQVNVYDTYNSQSWENTQESEESVGKSTVWDDTTEIPGKTRIKYEITTEINTDVVLLTGDFVSAEMPVLVRQDIEQDVTGARSPRVLSPGETYAVRAYVPDVSESVLSAASGNYTDSIKAVYLQLPVDYSDNVTALSISVTENATTPYEKAMAIDTYLARFPYSREVDELPEGADAVKNFLFTQKKGFCVHFASAMTVMLRSVGVPARLVVGYLPGDPGEEVGTYLLRDKHYHAWTQVYFPGYGWINFEPTPSNDESNVPVESSFVSVPDIKQSPEWWVWYYPVGAAANAPVNAPAPTRVRGTPVDGKLAFSDELGTALLIITGIALAFGVIVAITRLIRPFYARNLWRVDREHLASSAYSNLARLAALGDLIQEPQQTPMEFSTRIAEVIPEEEENLKFLVNAYEKDRFGRNKGRRGLYEEAELLKVRIQVYNAILQRRGKLEKFLWRY